MKPFLSIILAAIFLISASLAHAAPVQSVGVVKKFSATTVGTVSWVPLLSQTVKAVKGISVFNSGGSPLEIGMAASSTTANSEVTQLIIPAGPSGGSASAVGPAAVFYPMSASQSMRISVRSRDSQPLAGEVQVNIFYN